MVTDPQPGQRVRANRDIWYDGQDHHPAGFLCRAGEELVIREVIPSTAWSVALAVSHPNITDRSFLAAPEELDPIEEAHNAD